MALQSPGLLEEFESWGKGFGIAEAVVERTIRRAGVVRSCIFFNIVYKERGGGVLWYEEIREYINFFRE